MAHVVFFPMPKKRALNLAMISIPWLELVSLGAGELVTNDG
jgi:hypothetical protein